MMGCLSDAERTPGVREMNSWRRGVVAAGAWSPAAPADVAMTVWQQTRHVATSPRWKNRGGPTDCDKAAERDWVERDLRFPSSEPSNWMRIAPTREQL